MRVKLSERGVRQCLSLLFLLFWTSVASTVAADPTQGSDGYYELATADDLAWFADKVNSGDNEIDGRLTADIDLSSLALNHIGSESNPFKGSFAGGGHALSNLKLVPGAGCGLFGYVDGATIDSVEVQGVTAVTGESVQGGTGMGVVCGYAKDAVISNCSVSGVAFELVDSIYGKLNSVGGIVGYIEHGTVADCQAEGYIMVECQNVGGIVGTAENSTIERCLLKAEKKSWIHVWGANNVGGVAGLCSEKSKANTLVDCLVESAVKVTSEGTSGRICAAESFSDEPKSYDGWYEIHTATQLQKFEEMVNQNNATDAKCKLMADIDMSKIKSFTPIGSKTNPFKGQFDGQDHSISNLVIADQEYAGLFGYISEGAVKNIVLKNPTINNSYGYVGFIAGYATNSGDSCLIGDCHVVEAVLVGTELTENERNYVGGIVGKAESGARIEACSFQGTINNQKSYVGGIAGRIESGVAIARCYVVGTSLVDGTSKVGGVVGSVDGSATTMTDCYVDKPNGTVVITIDGSATESADIWGENLVKITNNNDTYVEDGLVYALTGATDVAENGGKTYITKVTDVDDKSKKNFHVINDIGSWNSYRTKSIENLKGIESLDFIDNNSNLSGTKASNWLDITIADYAFDATFKSLYMRYTMYADDDHIVMLRPDDVKPAGKQMFAQCPNAKIYVDAEYYEAFCNDSLWSSYKSFLVPTTSMRSTVNWSTDGVKYVYDRNRDAKGSMVVKKGKNDANVWMVHVEGAASNKTTLRIYQDIGETYNYNTTKIWAGAFKGNSDIQQVQFEQIMADASDIYYDFNIAIGDSAFANCENLEYFDVVLSSDMGDDHYEAIHPSQMPIGKGVFDGCKNVQIRVPRALLAEFQEDSLWKNYKDLLKAEDFNWTNFTENGVKYSYYTSEDGQTRYTNRDTTIMENIVKPWVGEYRNFKSNSVLCPDASETVYYLKASGIDNTTIDSKDGEVRLFNDIGTTTDYKTIELVASGFQGNTHVKSIIFEDCASYSGDANTSLSLVIPDETFKGCSNLKELNMFYYVTDGTNHYEAIAPTQIFIGENVFDGVDSTFHIRVLPDYYEDYINDANWSQYKKYIVPAYYSPTKQKPIEVDGITYDYVSYSPNTIASTEFSNLNASLWNAPIIVAEALYYSYSLLNIKEPLNSVINILKGTPSKLTPKDYLKVPSFAFMATKWQAKREINNSLGTLGSLNNAEKQVLAAAEKVNMACAAYRGYMMFGLTSAVAKPADLAAQNVRRASDYIVQSSIKRFQREPTWHINTFDWVTVRKRRNVEQMYVKSVGGNVADAVLYVHPEGSTDMTGVNHRKSCAFIADDAFRNKKNLKTISFKDNPNGYIPYVPMTVVLPDSCFAGCDNLTTINLVLNCRYQSREKSLTPSNFVLTGDFLAGCDTSKVKIKVGADVLDQFLDDEYWGKYKNLYETKAVANVEDQSEWGCRYTYHYDTNTMPLITESGDQNIWHVDIFGADDKDLKGNNGLAALINDYGNYFNYKLDVVCKKAFYGNENLKQLDVTDSHSFSGDVYTGFNITLRDSAFANCKNFRDFNLVYQVTDGSNHIESITPNQVALCNGVFDGCDNLRIKVDLDQEIPFLTSPNWEPYADKITPCLFEPMDENVFSLLKNYCMFKTDLNDNSWTYLDATRATPEGLKNRFRNNTDIESFDEFRTFKACGLDTIYSGMFSGCKKLQSIMLPDSAHAILGEAFKDNSLLASLTIPSKVDTIGHNAFKGSGLTSIICQNPVPAKADVDIVFSGLPSNYIIYVADSVEALYKEKWAGVADHINSLSNRKGLKVVHLTTAGTLADSLGLKYDADDYVLTGNYAQYDSLRVIGNINGKDIAVIRFMGGRDVDQNAKTPGHLTYLDLYEADLHASSHVYNASQLDELDSPTLYHINNKLTEDNCVDKCMFYGLSRLKTLILPKSATSIKKNAFCYCQNLETLVVGDGIKSVSGTILEACPNIQNLVLLPDKLNVDEDTWEAAAVSFYIMENIPSGRFSLIFTSCKSLPSYAGDIAYYSQADTILTCFEDDAVLEAMKKQHIFYASGLVGVGDIKGFVSGNADIRKFNELFYTSVDSLGEGSLTNMPNLQEVTLPADVKSITADAFKGCTALTKIWALSSECAALAEDAFEDLPENFVIIVPEGLEDQYRKAWPQYKEHIQGYRAPRVGVTEVTLTEKNTLGEKLGFTVKSKDNWSGASTFITSITGDMPTITGLKVSGPIGSKDIAVIRMLAGRDWEGNPVYTNNLRYLDLYDADIREDDIIFVSVESTLLSVKKDDVVPENMLYQCDNLETVILPRTAKEIDDYALFDMFSLETVVVGDNTTYIGNDALGECNNLSKMIFLCGKKPDLNHDAFTDPADPEDDNHKVSNMYVRKSLVNDYAADEQFTGHAGAINSKFADDELFRAYGSKAIANEDDLASVDSIYGWFDNFPGVTDLTSLSRSAITDLRSNELDSLANLKHIALPRTLTEIGAGVFSRNSNLAWADLSECDSLKTDIDILDITPTALLYTPGVLGASDKDNVVYKSGDDLNCERFVLTHERDYDVPKAFTAQGVTFTRKFAADSMYTLTLPFEMMAPKGAKVFQLEKNVGDTLHFSYADSIHTDMPYVLRTTDTLLIAVDDETFIEATPVRMNQIKTADFVMTGALKSISNADAADMKVMLLGDSSRWNLVTTANALSVDPFSAYMQGTSAAAGTSPRSVLEYVAPETLVLDEAKNLSALIEQHNGESVNVKVKRQFKANEWNTLCVPFSVPVKDTAFAGMQIVALAQIEDSVLTFTDVDDSIKAGVAYLVKPEEDVTELFFGEVTINNKLREATNDYDLAGTYEPVNGDDETIYTLKGGALELVSKNDSVNSLGGYFKVPSKDADDITLVIGDEVIKKVIETDLIEVLSEVDLGKTVEIYSVDGLYRGCDLRQVPKGVYIVNGVKMLKKEDW